MLKSNKRKYVLLLFIFILSTIFYFFYKHLESRNGHETFFSTLKGSDTETARLKLSPTTKEHVETLSTYLKDKEVCTVLIPALYGTEGFKDIDATKRYIKNELEMYYGDIYMFTILLKTENGILEPIGQIAFSCRTKGVLWLSYWLGKNFHRKGYMSELVPLVKKYFDKCSNLKQVHIQCLASNYGSYSICQKICGLFEKEKGKYSIEKSPPVLEKNKNCSVYVYKFDIKKESESSLFA